MGPPPLPVTPLSYAGSGVRPFVVPPFEATSLRIAVACWAVPLAMGTVSFLGGVACSLIRGQPGVALFASAGVWTIVTGVLLSVVGVVVLLAFVAQRWSGTSGQRWVMLVRPTLLVLALLASNYAVALGMALVAGACLH